MIHLLDSLVEKTDTADNQNTAGERNYYEESRGGITRQRIECL
jgi:hypothetical protein